MLYKFCAVGAVIGMLSLSSDYGSMVSMYNSVKGSSSCHNPNDALQILVQRRLDLDRA